jgi:hypothetical protein
VIALVYQESGEVNVIRTGVELRGAVNYVLEKGVHIGQQTRHTLAMMANSDGATPVQTRQLGEMKASVRAVRTTPWTLIVAVA